MQYLTDGRTRRTRALQGYDPKRKGFNQEVESTHDLDTMESTEEEASANAVTRLMLRPKRLSSGLLGLRRARASSFRRPYLSAVSPLANFLLAGTLGVTVAPLTLSHKRIARRFGLRSAPWRLLYHGRYVHPSEIWTALGSGMGGMESLSAMFRDRYVICHFSRFNLLIHLVVARKRMSRPIFFRRRK